ncbi:MAG: hypothetical protein BWY70_00247 [Bacteroidetes bacterium ADurb.Bin408]|nr:MAG: hypothetical protein BWY70_00247 [Bacteroidetes bacterium ADurb.Bin408]
MKTKTTTLLLVLLLSISLKAQILNGYFLANGDTVQGFTEFFFCKDSCYTFTFLATGGTPPYSYAWSTGSTTDHTTFCYSDLDPFNDDTLLVTVTDNNNHHESFFLRAQNYPDILQQICMVTVDPILNKNVIVWTQNINPDVIFYNIYRETTSLNQFELIGTVPRTSLSFFVDTASNPAQVAERYTITAESLCAESHFTSYHKTLHLTINTGINNTWNLIWENYTGENFPVKYRIWRGSTENGLELLDSVSPSVTTYTDLTPPSGILYYTLEMIPSYSCQAGLKNYYASSYSNKVSNSSLIGIDAKEISKSMAFVSPNPLVNTATLNLSPSVKKEHLIIEVFDLHGQKIKTFSNLSNNQLPLSRCDFKTAGVYFLRITNENNFEIIKLIVQ